MSAGRGGRDSAHLQSCGAGTCWASLRCCTLASRTAPTFARTSWKRWPRPLTWCTSRCVRHLLFLLEVLQRSPGLLGAQTGRGGGRRWVARGNRAHPRRAAPPLAALRDLSCDGVCVFVCVRAPARLRVLWAAAGRAGGARLHQRGPRARHAGAHQGLRQGVPPAHAGPHRRPGRRQEGQQGLQVRALLQFVRRRSATHVVASLRGGTRSAVSWLVLLLQGVLQQDGRRGRQGLPGGPLHHPLPGGPRGRIRHLLRCGGLRFRWDERAQHHHWPGAPPWRAPHWYPRAQARTTRRSRWPPRWPSTWSTGRRRTPASTTRARRSNCRLPPLRLPLARLREVIAVVNIVGPRMVTAKTHLQRTRAPAPHSDNTPDLSRCCCCAGAASSRKAGSPGIVTVMSQGAGGELLQRRASGNAPGVLIIPVHDDGQASSQGQTPSSTAAPPGRRLSSPGFAKFASTPPGEQQQQKLPLEERLEQAAKRREVRLCRSCLWWPSGAFSRRIAVPASLATPRTTPKRSASSARPRRRSARRGCRSGMRRGQTRVLLVRLSGSRPPSSPLDLPARSREQEFRAWVLNKATRYRSNKAPVRPDDEHREQKLQRLQVSGPLARSPGCAACGGGGLCFASRRPHTVRVHWGSVPRSV